MWYPTYGGGRISHEDAIILARTAGSSDWDYHERLLEIADNDTRHYFCGYWRGWSGFPHSRFATPPNQLGWFDGTADREERD